MTTRTPPLLTEWSPARLSAARLSGSLVPCGPGLRPAGWPETPIVRCGALARVFSSGSAAIERTAAWIWGVRRSPGHQLRFAAIAGRAPARFETAKAELSASWSSFRFLPDDITTLGGFAVTTRSRTFYDLVRATEPLRAPDVVACRLLLAAPGVAASIGRRARQGSRADRGRIRVRLRELGVNS